MLQPDVDVRGSAVGSQDIPDNKWDLTPSGLPLNIVSSVSRDTGPERQDQNNNHNNPPPYKDDHLANKLASIHSKEPSLSASVSSGQKRTYLRENYVVTIVIPTALPTV